MLQYFYSEQTAFLPNKQRFPKEYVLNLKLIKRTGSPEPMEQALTDLDMTKILTLIDPRMDSKKAIAFAESYFCGDAEELALRFSVLSEMKTLTDAAELQEAIDLIRQIEKEQESLNGAVTKLTMLLYRWRVMTSYVKAVRCWCTLLGKADPENGSERLSSLRSFFRSHRESALFSDCEKTLTELDETLPLPRYINIGMNVREDGYPVDLGILGAEGHIDLMKEEDPAEEPSLNALLSSDDTTQPSRSLGPEFVYNRGLYGSHFDEYIERSLEHEWRGRIAKASKIAEKVKPEGLDEITSLADDLQFYQIALLAAEAFETRGYTLCRPVTEENASLDIRGALYPDFILHNQGIRGNDLLLQKGNAVIITGPNHSGKTSYLKTIGQCYLLAQLGFFVPADSMTFEPVRHIFTLFSAGEDSSMTASRMGVEVKKLTEILKKSTDRDLILLNEPMTSTNPVEAVSICADLTRHFLDKGITHLLVTHLYDIYFLLRAQLSAADLEKLESLITQSYYDESSGVMVHSYRLIKHDPLGNSYARETASAYGITLQSMLADDALLSAARSYCDTHNIDSIYEGDDPHGISDDNGHR